ncbi:MAG: GGDEF domain-containing protein [Campylobacteraceae bacterium]|nr:GGDEF domain-containing protein [Campylobacteraceae bacterium]
MIIDQNALDNLNFSLGDNPENNSSQSEDKIHELISKYAIVENTNRLIDSQENNYLFVINHIINLYYLNKPIPEDIKELIKYDLEFKMYLDNDLNRRLNNLVSNNATLFFKEIGNIINLLSLGNQYKIFETYATYNLEEVSKLFRDYEAFLKDLDPDSELFDFTFNCYVILIEAFTQLCIINSTDIQRKKTINPIIELLTESNNMLKFTVTLSEGRVDQLNNILGKLLYYFAHISYYEILSKTMNYLLEEFSLNLERQLDGYLLSKETEFGNNPKDQEREFIRFKSNNSFLLLTLIKKLEENFKDEDFFNNTQFQKLLVSYNENFSLLIQHKTVDTLESFRKKLLNSLVLTYLPYHHTSATKLTYTEVIDNFIFAGEEFEPQNLETIHNILLFSRDIEEHKYLQISSILSNCEPVKNDYYQFFCVKILDVIVNKFIHKKPSENIDEFFQEIFQYVEANKTASQLLGVFSKIYLSLALYYSKIFTKKTITKAKSYYSTFKNINGNISLSNEFKEMNHEILVNFGKYHTQELAISKESYNEEDLRILGHDQIKSYLSYNEINLKFLINQEISNLTSQILSENNFDYEDINHKISYFISTKLFYGIANVNIKGLTKINSNIEDTGYKQYSIPIIGKYEILFIFPAMYEDTFKTILHKNKDYIVQNVSNILIGYTKNNILYIDEVTHLENITKIKNDLPELPAIVTFIELSIPSLIYVNKKYGQHTGDKFFRAIGQKIESFLDQNDRIYRLSGARLGIMLHRPDSYSDLIRKIFHFTIALKGEQIEGDYILAVTRGKKEEILIKSAYNIEEAITLKKSINIKI